MAQPRYVAKGVNGQIEVYDDMIKICRRGVLSFLTQGLKGDKDILISSITSVQFKGAGLTNGYIQFAFMGGQEAKRGLFQAPNDENTVMFNYKQEEAFEEVKRLIGEGGRQAVAPAQSQDPSEQIEKLAALRDKGLITDEEFAAGKKKILGI